MDNLYAAGVVSWRAGDLPAAERHLRGVLARHPLSFDPHAILGLVLLDAGRAAESATHLRESLRLNPYTQRVRSALLRAEAEPMVGPGRPENGSG